MTELILRPDLGKDADWSVASFETDASVTVEQLKGSPALARQIETWEAQMRRFNNWEPLDNNVWLFECGHPYLDTGLESSHNGAMLVGTPIKNLGAKKWLIKRQFIKPVVRIEYDDALPQTFDSDNNDEWGTTVAEPGIDPNDTHMDW